MNRIWIYQSNKPLHINEQEAISLELDAFIQRWSAHKVKLDAHFEIKYNQFIILYVNQEEVIASGCSIDDSVHFMMEIDRKYNLSLFDRGKMAYLDINGDVQVCNLNDISDLIESGKLQDDTKVFNNTILDESQLTSLWKIPFKQSGFSAFA